MKYSNGRVSIEHIITHNKQQTNTDFPAIVSPLFRPDKVNAIFASEQTFDTGVFA
jgi:hypothetical protein